MNLKEKYTQHVIDVIDNRCKFSKNHNDMYRPFLSNNRNLANFNLRLKEMIFTLGVQHAEGAHFTDLNGNLYLDMTMGFGVHLFGHKVIFLENAIRDQLNNGTVLGPLYNEAGEVAKLIQELTGVDRCAFYSTGTEAVMVAMRIARAVTKKNKVVIFEGSYHGTHDSLLAMKSDPSTYAALTSVPGISQNALDNTIILKYGEQASLTFIKNQESNIAAILTEPVMSRHPEIASQEFLKQIRAVCTDGNIALIFDEVITGFRMDNGGVAKLFGIVPDIVTYGKVLGGGMPIGVVAGKSLYLDAIDGGQWKFGDDSVPLSKTTFTAGTFNHHPFAMATAKVTLQFLRDDKGKFQQGLNVITEKMCNDLNTFFHLEGFPISMVYFGSLFRFKVNGIHKFIFYSLLKEGIYIWEGRNCFLSTAHTDQDITFFIEKVKKCCFELAAAGILIGKKKNEFLTNSKNYIQAAIEIDTVLEKSSLNFVSRYLFHSIPKLRSVSCSVCFKTLIENGEDFSFTDMDLHDGLILSVYQNTQKTIIHFSADRGVCDGWSVILFFKSLAKCYTSLQKMQPLPDIDYPAKESEPKTFSDSKQQVIRELFPAKTIHSTIPVDSIAPEMRPKLFAFMLFSFYRSLQEVNPMDIQVISIPMAGQLLTRNLKMFDNCTVYFPYKFQKTVFDADETNTDQLVNNIEIELKNARLCFNNFDMIQNQSDIVFNMDNLDFDLSFDNENGRLLVVEERITGYKIVCNVSKLKESLLITLKYATELIADHAANNLLHRFLTNMQKE